jgi:hypothetical protein
MMLLLFSRLGLITNPENWISFHFLRDYQWYSLLFLCSWMRKVNKHCKWIFVLYKNTFFSSDLNMKSQTVEMKEKISLKKSQKWIFNFWSIFSRSSVTHFGWPLDSCFVLQTMWLEALMSFSYVLIFSCLYAYFFYHKVLNVLMY